MFPIILAQYGLIIASGLLMHFMESFHLKNGKFCSVYYNIAISQYIRNGEYCEGV